MPMHEVETGLRKSPYTILLFTLLLLLVVWPTIQQADLGKTVEPIVHGAFFTLMLVGVLYAVRRPTHRPIFVALLVFALVGTWADYLIEGLETTLIGNSIGAVFLFAVTVAVIKRVLSPGRVTADRILAAFCGYLFMGMLWANFYSIIWHLDDGAFLFPEDERVVHTDFVYYSFVTLTTLGYGEISPVHPLARSLSYVEAMTGQLYVAVVIARLVALEIMDSQRNAD